MRENMPSTLLANCWLATRHTSTSRAAHLTHHAIAVSIHERKHARQDSIEAVFRVVVVRRAVDTPNVGGAHQLAKLCLGDGLLTRAAATTLPPLFA
jgi:hypothetical protein